MQDNRGQARARWVAVAEDDADMRDLLVRALPARGYDIREYGRGDTLLESLLEARDRGDEPDLVITDVSMPGRDGLAVLRGLREHGFAAPVVLITAFGSEQTLNEAFSLGATMVLSKPFAVDDLRRVVRCFLSDAGSLQT